MRWFMFGLLAMLMLSGMGCLALERQEDEMRSGAQPDPEQSRWNRILFGTRTITVVPQLQGYKFATAAPENAEKPIDNSKP